MAKRPMMSNAVPGGSPFAANAYGGDYRAEKAKPKAMSYTQRKAAEFKERYAAEKAASVGSPGGTGQSFAMPKDSEVSDHSNPRSQK
jgi:hypothetical protein